MQTQPQIMLAGDHFILRNSGICFASWNASSRLLLPKLLTNSSVELLPSRAQSLHLEIGDYWKLQTRYQFLIRTGECPICLSHIISITINTSGTVHQSRPSGMFTFAKCKWSHSNRSCSPVLKCSSRAFFLSKQPTISIGCRFSRTVHYFTN